MKRLQIYIEEDVDDRLGVEAARRGVSKAAVVREAVGAYLAGADEGLEPLRALIGDIDADPGEDIDAVVYGP
jgi:plasmid stability protein